MAQQRSTVVVTQEQVVERIVYMNITDNIIPFNALTKKNNPAISPSVNPMIIALITSHLLKKIKTGRTIMTTGDHSTGLKFVRIVGHYKIGDPLAAANDNAPN